MADTPGTTLNEGPPPDAPKGHFRFPTAFAVLFLVLLLVNRSGHRLSMKGAGA